MLISKLGDVLMGMATGSGALGSKIVGQIATVWTRYQFIVEGKVHHCGHAIYSLVKLDDRRMIATVVNEAERACEQAP